MERDHLAQLLDENSDASSACRSALLQGAELIVWDGTTPADRMVPTYVRRQMLTIATGTATVGFPEALAALRSAGVAPVRLGQVTATEPPYLYMVFLTGEPTAVVACFGIRRDPQGAAAVTG